MKEHTATSATQRRKALEKHKAQLRAQINILQNINTNSWDDLEKIEKISGNYTSPNTYHAENALPFFLCLAIPLIARSFVLAGKLYYGEDIRPATEYHLDKFIFSTQIFSFIGVTAILLNVIYQLSNGNFSESGKKIKDDSIKEAEKTLADLKNRESAEQAARKSKSHIARIEGEKIAAARATEPQTLSSATPSVSNGEQKSADVEPTDANASAAAPHRKLIQSVHAPAKPPKKAPKIPTTAGAEDKVPADQANQQQVNISANWEEFLDKHFKKKPDIKEKFAAICRQIAENHSIDESKLKKTKGNDNVFELWIKSKERVFVYLEKANNTLYPYAVAERGEHTKIPAPTAHMKAAIQKRATEDKESKEDKKPKDDEGLMEAPTVHMKVHQEIIEDLSNYQEHTEAKAR